MGVCPCGTSETLQAYHSGQLNNGNASIAGIFRWLEEQLEVSIGKPSRRLTEIRRRKRLSQTRYLDQMRD